MRLLTSADTPLRRGALALGLTWIATIAVITPPPARADSVSDALCKVPFADVVCSAVEKVQGANEFVDFAKDPLGYVARSLSNSVVSSMNSLTEDLTH
ncbi:hypothetical protein AB0D08_06875 [Kitasatospora sp. NPDC048540]|uniref:hypothetical protein n=1 Tax=Kitasatospora sp. NPDC048540 TaxID=3155634 RepID=UPI0033EADBFA